jgi:hypothetical protein
MDNLACMQQTWTLQDYVAKDFTQWIEQMLVLASM